MFYLASSLSDLKACMPSLESQINQVKYRLLIPHELMQRLAQFAATIHTLFAVGLVCFTADIVSGHNRQSTAVHNNISNGFILFKGSDNPD